MEKLVYLLGDAGIGVVPSGRADLLEALLDRVPALAEAGAREIGLAVADVDDPDVGSVTQMNHSGLLDAAVSLWVDHLDGRGRIEAVLAGLCARQAGYLVTESVLRDYPTRDWRSGEASPGIALVTTFPKPDRIDDETFYARWHGSHGPLSLEVHPLTRYVRNAVARGLTPGAPPFRAIVSESVASAAVAADVDAFYGGRENRRRVVADLLSFADVETMSTVAMREYILEV